MLCLSRKETQAILIEDQDTGEMIKIHVMEIGRGKVRLGISANEKQYRIWRPEAKKQHPREVNRGN